MPTYLSRVEYTAAGGVDTFAVPFSYLDRAHVLVTVNGIAAAFTWPTAGSVKLGVVPAAGAVVAIRRSTSPAARLVNYSDTARLTAADLNLGDTQSFFIAQEAVDLVDSGLGAAVSTAQAASAAASAAAASIVGLSSSVKTPEQFGALNDGVTDDSAAVQAAINAALAQPRGGTVLFRPGAGYRVTAEIACHPVRALRLEWAPGSRVVSDRWGVGSRLLYATHPGLPRDSDQPAPVRDGGGAFNPGGSLTLVNPVIELAGARFARQDGPVFFEYRYASDFHIEGHAGGLFHAGGNTAIRLSGLWNCRLGALNVWNGGHFKPRRFETAAFATASGSANITASAGTFVAADVGKALTMVGAAGVETFLVASVTSATVAVATRAAEVTQSGCAGLWEEVRGSMANGGTTLTLANAGFVSTDVGRIVYVDRARLLLDGRAVPLRARITAVLSPTTATLSAPAQAAVSDAELAFSPAVETISDVGSGNGEATNDFVWENLSIYDSPGLGLVVADAVNATFPNLKIHPANAYFNLVCGGSRAWFIGCTGLGVAGSDFEGTVTSRSGGVRVIAPLGQHWFSDCRGTLWRGMPAFRLDGGGVAGALTVRGFSAPNAVSTTALLELVSADVPASAAIEGPVSGMFASVSRAFQADGNALALDLRGRAVDGVSGIRAMSQDGKTQQGVLYLGSGSMELRDGAFALVALIRSDGITRLPVLPTSTATLTSGMLWRDPAAGNVVKQVP